MTTAALGISRSIALPIAFWATLCACSPGGGSTSAIQKNIGAPEGQTCDTSSHNEGCLNKNGGIKARMRCSAVTGLWTEIAECAMNETCTQNNDPNDVTGVAKVTVCELAYTVPATDAGGASDGSVDAGVDAGGSDAGQSKPDTIVVLPTAKEVDPACIDGKYSEPLPNTTASLSAEFEAYSAEGVMDFIYGVLSKRYAFGKFLVESAVKHNKQNCVDLFLPASKRGSPTSVMSRMGVLVHECGHLYDMSFMSPGSTYYSIYFDVDFACPGLQAGIGGGGGSFSRNLINGDKFSLKRPPCEKGKGSHGCDSYAKIYLGDNGSGSQGFNMLFEETVQYVNSLANGYAFMDQSAGSHSDRDGILTFLWYTERYLHMARNEYPKVHAAILANKCWRDVILTVWGRAWLHLEATKSFPSLGIDDAKIIELVRDPVLLQEIGRVRQAAGCK